MYMDYLLIIIMKLIKLFLLLRVHAGLEFWYEFNRWVRIYKTENIEHIVDLILFMQNFQHWLTDWLDHTIYGIWISVIIIQVEIWRIRPPAIFWKTMIIIIIIITTIMNHTVSTLRNNIFQFSLLYFRSSGY